VARTLNLITARLKRACLLNVDADAAKPRALARRFRGVLRGNDSEKLAQWLDDTQSSGVSSIERFARVLHRDIDAVRNAKTLADGAGHTLMYPDTCVNHSG
jgi:hypothetical protein